MKINSRTEIIRCWKGLWQNPMSLNVKSLEECGDTGDIFQHNKGNIQQTQGQHYLKWNKILSILHENQEQSKDGVLSPPVRYWRQEERKGTQQERKKSKHPHLQVTIPYIKGLQDSTPKPLHPINKAARYKIHTCIRSLPIHQWQTRREINWGNSAFVNSLKKSWNKSKQWRGHVQYSRHWRKKLKTGRWKDSPRSSRGLARLTLWTKSNLQMQHHPSLSEFQCNFSQKVKN